jgi:hypothetical protein
VLGFAGYKGKFATWLCECTCGKLSVIEGARLKFWKGASCGCTVRLSPAAKKLSSLLTSIKRRCYDPNAAAYRYYGARGITVCERWRESVENFADDMGPRPSQKHIVARRNRSGNYTPANCYWEQRTKHITT